MNYAYIVYYARVHILSLSQLEFCKTIHIVRPYLSSIENGKKRPSLDILERLAECCNIPLPALLSIGQNKDEIIEFLENNI